MEPVECSSKVILGGDSGTKFLDFLLRDGELRVLEEGFTKLLIFQILFGLMEGT